MENPSILLVEDDLLIAHARVRDLSGRGYRIDVARSGTQALEYLKGSRTTIPGLVLMDVDLGDEPDGIDTSRQILATTDIPILFLTNHASPDYLRRAQEVGVFGYIPKSAAGAFLEASIRMALQLHDTIRQLRASEAKFRAMVDSHPLAVVEADLTGSILTWNPAAEALFGWRREDVVGRYAPLVPESGKEEFDEIRKRTAAGEIFINREIVRQRKDGRLLRLLLSNSPVRDASGAVRSILAIFSVPPDGPVEEGAPIVPKSLAGRIDVSTTADPSGLVSAFFGTTKQLVLFLDRTGRILEAGNFVRTVLGRESSNSLKGEDWAEALVHPAESSRAREFLKSVAALGECESLLSFRTGFGARIVLELYGRCVDCEGGGGGILTVGSVAANPSAFLSDGDLSASATGRILSGIEDAVLALGPECSVIRECNRSASVVFGLPSPELVGRTMDSLSAEGEPFAPWASGELNRHGLAIRELRFRRCTGDVFPASVQVLPVVNERGVSTRAIVLIKDLSGEVRMSAERGYMIARLKEMASSIADLSARMGEEEAPRDLAEWGATPRQHQIARCLSTGMSNKEIAHALDISESSVKVQIYSLYRKTKTRSRVEFVRFLRERGVSL